MFIICLNFDFMIVRKSGYCNDLLFDKVLNVFFFLIIWFFECNLYLVLVSIKKYLCYDKLFCLFYILFLFV